MSSAEQVQTAYETIAVSRDGAVVTITLNRPDALNAITVQMGEEMTRAGRMWPPSSCLKVRK